MAKTPVEKSGQAKATRGRREEVKFEVVDGPEMTREECEQLVHLFARMVFDDFERQHGVEKPARASPGNDKSEVSLAPK
jgi:hypothetical protein